MSAENLRQPAGNEITAAASNLAVIIRLILSHDAPQIAKRQATQIFHYLRTCALTFGKLKQASALMLLGQYRKPLQCA